MKNKLRRVEHILPSPEPAVVRVDQHDAGAGLQRDGHGGQLRGGILGGKQALLLACHQPLRWSQWGRGGCPGKPIRPKDGRKADDRVAG